MTAAPAPAALVWLPGASVNGWSPVDKPDATQVNPVLPLVVGVGIAWAALTLGGNRGLFVLGLLSLPAAAGFVLRGLAHPEYGDIAGLAAGVAAVLLLFGLYFAYKRKPVGMR